ncbi:hypothetical protein BASA81_000377 [Batrachochytrium salamandrivorans]|nr:hypothetical protein BASA81_000377 [Batrachochytrium salamandrivorans]
MLFSKLVKRAAPSTAKLPADLSTLKFGQMFSPHMLTVDWTLTGGWEAPQIGPLEHFSLHPASSCLHYGVQCFEGLKAFRGSQDDKIRLFRPDMNIKRFKKSLDRLCLPNDFDETEFLNLMRALVREDQAFVPKGPYYPTGFKPVNLLAEEKAVRAWVGGTGEAKIGANYAIALGPQTQAQRQGHSQVLWLFNDQLTEVGTMNLFVVLGNAKTGEVREICTPALNGTILPGVTRDSVLSLCREWYGNAVVKERTITMQEVIKANQNGELVEVTGLGTAALVSPVGKIEYRGEQINIPLLVDGKMGPVAKRVWNALTDIQYGRSQRLNWTVEV